MSNLNLLPHSADHSFNPSQILDFQQFITTTPSGEAIISSLDLAKAFNRTHRHVLRDIRSIEKAIDFNESKIRLIEYTDSRYRKKPAYNLTKNTFLLVSTGFTGKKAMQTRWALIQAFDQLLRNKQLQGGDNTAQIEEMNVRVQRIEQAILRSDFHQPPEQSINRSKKRQANALLQHLHDTGLMATLDLARNLSYHAINMPMVKKAILRRKIAAELQLLPESSGVMRHASSYLRNSTVNNRYTNTNAQCWLFTASERKAVATQAPRQLVKKITQIEPQGDTTMTDNSTKNNKLHNLQLQKDACATFFDSEIAKMQQTKQTVANEFDNLASIIANSVENYSPEQDETITMNIDRAADSVTRIDSSLDQCRFFEYHPEVESVTEINLQEENQS